jgi:twitching motility protein PilT
MARIDDILNQMMDRDASDLHIASGCAPYLRVHGEMVRLNYKDLSPGVGEHPGGSKFDSRR